MGCKFTYITKHGKKVNVYDRILPETKAKLEYGHKVTMESLKNGNELRNYDDRYNCHGFTFISRLGYVGVGDTEKRAIHIPGQSDYIYNPEVEKVELDNALSDYEKIEEISNSDIEKFKNNGNIKIGDIVLYLKGTLISHSCIIFKLDNILMEEPSIKVLSKFGKYGEFLHDIYDTYALDLYGKYIQIWSHKSQTLID